MSRPEIPIAPASTAASDAILLFREMMAHSTDASDQFPPPLCSNPPIETQRCFYTPVRGDKVRVVSGDFGLPIPPSLSIGQVYEFWDASCWYIMSPDGIPLNHKSIFAAMVKPIGMVDPSNCGGILVALQNLEPVNQ